MRWLGALDEVCPMKALHSKQLRFNVFEADSNVFHIL